MLAILCEWCNDFAIARLCAACLHLARRLSSKANEPISSAWLPFDLQQGGGLYRLSGMAAAFKYRRGLSFIRTTNTCRRRGAKIATCLS